MKMTNQHVQNEVNVKETVQDEDDKRESDAYDQNTIIML